MSPKQHSLQDLQENYEGTIGILSKYRTKMLSIIDEQAAQKLVKEFEEKALGILVNVSESAIQVADRKQSKQQNVSSTSSREKEDFAHSYANTVAKRINPEQEKFFTMNELLDDVIRLEAEMLSRGSIHIPVRIFSPKHGRDVVGGNGGGMEETKTAPKYESLVRVLFRRNIEISALMVGVETLEKSQMRKVPYRVVWMMNPLRTICISDEVGEKTYVYHGFVDIASLAVHEKGEPIHGIQAIGVTYSGAYELNLEKAIFNDNITPGEYAPIIPNIPPATPEFVPNAEILIYQSILIAHEKELADAGIIQENGVWYFGDAKGRRFWPDINGKKLGSFPNRGFNKAQSIGNKRHEMQNAGALKEMFRVLGFAVANDEQEKIRWGMMLQNAEKELAEAGIIQENGLWYFGDAKGREFLPDINGKRLRSFPNGGFNKTQSIGDKDGTILNTESLKEMFSVLGLAVASDEQEKIRWGMMLQNAEKELVEVGIIQENGLWYLGDAKGIDFWPNMNGKRLVSFPNGVFNKAHGIGDKDGVVLNAGALKEMFNVLGLAVATEEQELKRQQERNIKILIPQWKKELENAEKELAGVEIIQKNGLWYFGDAKGRRDWPDIHGRNLVSFPNGGFNKARSIGSERGKIQNIEALKKMLKALGLVVASDEQELERKKNDKRQK